METRKFKTTAKCGGCVATMKPFLAQIAPGNWIIDLGSTDKILTITCDCTPEQVVETVKAAGFKAELIG